MDKQQGFSRYELHPRVLEALPALGFSRPTPVQEQVIPRFIQKRNLIVEAPTGTGKTAAYGLPLISRLDLLKRSTQALILVPSRELAQQVQAALQGYFVGDQLKVAAVIGGTSIEESQAAIKSGAHILVVVPGRLRDVMGQWPYPYLWRDIRFLIVDEGDKLTEAGFMRDLDEIRSHIRSTAQVGFFSATISPDSEQLMRERFPKIETIRLSPRQMLRNIQFAYARVPEGQREASLVSLLQKKGLQQALIFAGGREEIYSLTGFLRNAGLRAEAYYGDQDQQSRTHILSRFREGHISYLVASDLAARGLDIEALPAVINVVVPEAYDFYLHRVGRTGRAGLKGAVYNLICSEREQIYLNNHHQKIGLPLKEFSLKPVPASQFKADTEARWVKAHLSRGKRDKIRPGDIVGFLVHAGGLAAEDIGTITVQDAYSLVDLPLGLLQDLQQRDDLKIKGKSVKVRRFRVEEERDKARSIHKLKQDRKR